MIIKNIKLSNGKFPIFSFLWLELNLVFLIWCNYLIYALILSFCYRCILISLRFSLLSIYYYYYNNNKFFFIKKKNIIIMYIIQSKNIYSVMNVILLLCGLINLKIFVLALFLFRSGLIFFSKIQPVTIDSLVTEIYGKEKIKLTFRGEKKKKIYLYSLLFDRKSKNLSIIYGKDFFYIDSDFKNSI